MKIHLLRLILKKQTAAFQCATDETPLIFDGRISLWKDRRLPNTVFSLRWSCRGWIFDICQNMTGAAMMIAWVQQVRRLCVNSLPSRQHGSPPPIPYAQHRRPAPPPQAAGYFPYWLLQLLPHKKLQLVQNSAARIISRTPVLTNHITSALQQLHWLLVEQLLAFKATLRSYSSIHLTVPSVRLSPELPPTRHLKHWLPFHF